MRKLALPLISTDFNSMDYYLNLRRCMTASLFMQVIIPVFKFLWIILLEIYAAFTNLDSYIITGKIIMVNLMLICALNSYVNSNCSRFSILKAHLFPIWFKFSAKFPNANLIIYNTVVSIAFLSLPSHILNGDALLCLSLWNFLFHSAPFPSLLNLPVLGGSSSEARSLPDSQR